MFNLMSNFSGSHHNYPLSLYVSVSSGKSLFVLVLYELDKLDEFFSVLVLKEIIIIIIIIPEIILLLFISHRSHRSHRFLCRFKTILFNLNQICSNLTKLFGGFKEILYLWLRRRYFRSEKQKKQDFLSFFPHLIVSLHCQNESFDYAAECGEQDLIDTTPFKSHLRVTFIFHISYGILD